MSEWIKCSERMPELGQTVLLYFDETKCQIMQECGYISFITIAEYSGDDETPWDDADANAAIEDGCQASHWMPPPDPPKGDE